MQRGFLNGVHPNPAYSIPTLDLADQKLRQIIVDREKDQYLGHPTTVLLEDQDTMIAVYPKSHGRGTVVTTTYGHWDEGEQPYVVSVRLRLKELDSMAAEGDVMNVERRLP